MQIITKYFDDFNDLQKDQMKALQPLYREWNEKINVISRKDIESLYEKHVLHSLCIAKFFEFEQGDKIVDVGCGGGFPGIPLAILFPEVQFTLVDSVGKKITVVNEVASALNLKNVTGIHGRAEKLKQKFNFVTSRAVTAFPKFVSLTRNLVDKKHKGEIRNGIIYIKGGDFEEEIKPFKNRIHIHELSSIYEESFYETKKLIYLPF